MEWVKWLGLRFSCMDGRLAGTLRARFYAMLLTDASRMLL